MNDYLVVYEDELNNKESIKTNKIGDAIKEIVRNYNISCDCDIDKLNSENHMTMLTFGYGFYDIECFDKFSEEEYRGRIMIFYIGEDD